MWKYMPRGNNLSSRTVQEEANEGNTQDDVTGECVCILVLHSEKCNGTAHTLPLLAL